eukprot:gene15166-biopygen17159
MPPRSGRWVGTSTYTTPTPRPPQCARSVRPRQVAGPGAFGSCTPSAPRPADLFGASVGRPRAGWVCFPRIPPWHACLARFLRIGAAMRTAPGARKVGPDDTDGLRA